MSGGDAIARQKLFGFDFGLQGANVLELTSDYTVTPVDAEMPRYERSGTDVKFGAAVGLAERFDLSLETAWDSPLMLQGKYQLLVDPQGKAKKGNSSLAVTAAVGSHGQSGSAEGLFDGAYDAYEMRAYAADASIIAGHRFADFGLVYGGPFVQQYWINGSHTLDDGPEVGFDLDANQYGVNLGLAFTLSENFQLMVEAVFAESNANESRVFSGFLSAHLAVMRF